jgi:Ca2+-binding EF-hand superfamily protein
MISDLVEEGRGQIDFNEFLDLMTARVSNKDTREDLKKVFNLFDDEKSGYISIKSLKKVIKDLGENIDEHELQEMIEKADQDHDGLVSEEEFYNIMTRKVART